MKKIFRIIAILILLSLVGIILYGVIIHEKEPHGLVSDEAKNRATKLRENLNYDQWLKTNWISWDFLGQHQYIWNKQNKQVQVSWNDQKVLLDITDRNSSLCYKNSTLIENEDRINMIEEAWSYFCNDSFWLIAPYKILDDGTRHSFVEVDGKKGLKVKYSSGGVTPGDSYVWDIDHEKPGYFRMWTSIIPVGGLEVSWEGWEEKSTGIIVSTLHKSDIFTMKFDNIKAGFRFEDIGLLEDPFLELK